MTGYPVERKDCDVVIVGAGPVGITLAALLAQAGLSVFVGDSSRDIYPLPRAAHLDHEVMRLLQQLGITEEIAPAIIAPSRLIFQNRGGDVLLEFDLRKPEDTGWHGYMMHQPGVERAIRARLSEDPLVTLRTGAAFERLAQDSDSVHTRWRGDDGYFEVTARYLVGCDGASSPVRNAVGLGIEDLNFDEPWLVLDLVVDADNDFPEINMQYCDPGRPTTYMIMGNDRRRFEFMLKPGENADVMLEDETIRRLLEPWSTRGVRSFERRAVYRFHALIAERWHSGRVFIAGDAAHQMPPFAGQGLCSGIRDAAALAWRIPLALQSADDRLLLESYQDERDPHVRAITASAMAVGRAVCTLDPGAAAARDTDMLAARAAGAPVPDISSPTLRVTFGLPDTPLAGERFFQPVVDDGGAVLRMDDVLGPGAWLIAKKRFGDVNVPAGVRIVSLDDPELAPFSGQVDAWLAKAGAPAVLVRADRYVFGTGELASLLGAYRTLAGLAD